MHLTRALSQQQQQQQPQQTTKREKEKKKNRPAQNEQQQLATHLKKTPTRTHRRNNTVDTHITRITHARTHVPEK
jgi:hypothetical protein